MNKSSQISYIAAKAGITKAMAGAAYEGFVDALMQSIKESGEASIPGFGRFMLVTAKERTMRNPKTGEPVVVPQHTKLTFKPSSAMKNYVADI